MTFELIGSLTSPYVRRLRLFLSGIDHRFTAMDIYEGEGDSRLSRLNPIKKIPVLVEDGQPLWESRVIHNHLRVKLGRPALSFAEENAVSAIDALQDVLIQTFLMRRFGHPIDPANAYFKRHADRKKLILAHLGATVAGGLFGRWDYPAMSLYTMLDWSLFRATLTEDDVGTEMLAWLRASAGQPLVGPTDPRKA